MATNAFCLYRVRLFESSQRGFWEGQDRSEVLRRAISSKPSLFGRGRNEWHIGNVHEISSRAIAFRMGRESPTLKESFDPVSHDFRKLNEPIGPSSLAVFDLPLGVLAIAMRSSLATNPELLGKRFEELLRASGPLIESSYNLHVGPIYDPSDFIEKLRSAHKIKMFFVNFRRPNPTDINKWFQQPLQNALALAEGEKGSVGFDGENLNPEILASISKAFSATGDEVKAKMQLPDENSLRWHKNKSSMLGFSAEDGVSLSAVYEEMMSIYAQLKEES
ncbi:MAG: hypothetical protein Q8R51_14140 [Azonexus sp.]|nr:hypothetical protein [Azonexus sp.]